jgi:hypothetical protein
MLRIVVNERWGAQIFNFVTVVKYSLTINTVKENIHKNLLFSVNTIQQPFHKRLNGHMSDLIKKTFVPVSQHSRLSDHSLEDFNRMRILIKHCERKYT